MSNIRRQLAYGQEARQALAEGIYKVSRAVRTTLGPQGRTVLIANKVGPGTMTKDGVTVARSIQLPDPLEGEGARLCIEAATKSNMDAGDGTTTVTVLVAEMVRAGLQHVAQGGNPVRLVQGIQQATDQALQVIEKMAVPVDSPQQIEYVASISGNDPEIGQIIAQAIDAVGRDGVVSIEPGGQQTRTDIVEGYQLDRGWASPYFCNSPKMEAVYENCLVLVAREKFSLAQQAAQVLEQCIKQQRPLLLVCSEVDGDALVTFVMNRQQGGLPIVVVQAPSWGPRQADYLDDLAQFVGSKYIDPDQGFDPDNLTPDMLGSCRRVVVTQDSCTLFEGGGDIMPRVQELRALSAAGTELEVLRYRERLAKLTQGLAVIRIGAQTEVELIERKHRFEDALAATRAAVAEGVVPGGGYTLLKASQAIKLPKDPDARAGALLVRQALRAPMKQIADNAGYDGQEVVRRGRGFDALRGEYCDLAARGILDPAKVSRCAVQNAASITALVLTCECVNYIETPPEAK